jgi:hypothetical protein
MVSEAEALPVYMLSLIKRIANIQFRQEYWERWALLDFIGENIKP